MWNWVLNLSVLKNKYYLTADIAIDGNLNNIYIANFKLCVKFCIEGHTETKQWIIFINFQKLHGGINTSTIQTISWEGNRWNNGHGKDNRRKYKQQLTGIVF